jgi:hypothetical protein
MTIAEARQLKVGDRVRWNGESNGEVTDRSQSGRVFEITWDDGITAALGTNESDLSCVDWWSKITKLDEVPSRSPLAVLALEAQQHTEWWDTDEAHVRQFICIIQMKPCVGWFGDPFLGVVMIRGAGSLRMTEEQMQKIPATWLLDHTKEEIK